MFFPQLSLESIEEHALNVAGHRGDTYGDANLLATVLLHAYQLKTSGMRTTAVHVVKE